MPVGRAGLRLFEVPVDPFEVDDEDDWEYHVHQDQNNGPASWSDEGQWDNQVVGTPTRRGLEEHDDESESGLDSTRTNSNRRFTSSDLDLFLALEGYETPTPTVPAPRQLPYTFAQAPFECPICYDSVRQATVPVCGHVFCWNCIRTCVIEGSGICPVCRGSLTILSRVYDIDKVMDAYFASIGTGRPIRVASSHNPDSTDVPAQTVGLGLTQVIRAEWAYISCTLRNRSFVDIVRWISPRVFGLLRQFPWMFVLAIGNSIMFSFLLSQYIMSKPQFYVSSHCELKMSGWEHLIAAIRSLFGLVPAPNPSFVVHTPVVVIKPGFFARFIHNRFQTIMTYWR